MRQLVNAEQEIRSEAREHVDPLIALLNAGPPLPAELLIKDALESISRAEHLTHTVGIAVWASSFVKTIRRS